MFLLRLAITSICIAGVGYTHFMHKTGLDHKNRQAYDAFYLLEWVWELDGGLDGDIGNARWFPGLSPSELGVDSSTHKFLPSETRSEDSVPRQRGHGCLSMSNGNEPRNECCRYFAYGLEAIDQVPKARPRHLQRRDLRSLR